MSPQPATTAPAVQATKSLAIPSPGKHPGFEEVVGIVLMSATVCNQSVCVLCLRPEMLERWMCRLRELSVTTITLLDVVNTNRATLKDWKKLLSSQAYDVTVLHGAYPELRANRLSVGYVKELVNAVPSGLVILA